MPMGAIADMQKRTHGYMGYCVMCYFRIHSSLLKLGPKHTNCACKTMQVHAPCLCLDTAWAPCTLSILHVF